MDRLACWVAPWVVAAIVMCLVVTGVSMLVQLGLGYKQKELDEWSAYCNAKGYTEQDCRYALANNEARGRIIAQVGRAKLDGR